MDEFEVEVTCMKHCIFMQECTPFIGENHNAKEEVNKQNPNAVVIVKRTDGVYLRIKVVGHGPIASV